MVTTGKSSLALDIALVVDLRSRPLEDAPCLTLWVPLIDCPASMGPMSFVSGTHKSRAAEHLEITDESDRLIKNLIRRNELTVAPAVDMKAGDATL